MPTLETAEKKAIKDLLQLKGWFVFHNLQGLGAYKGLPDLTAIKKGIVVQIEVKAGRGTQSEHQAHFEIDWTYSGGFYVCGGFEAVEKFINSLHTINGLRKKTTPRKE